MRALVVLLLCGACSGPSSDPGLAARVQVHGATFYLGKPPAPKGGPAVAIAQFVRTSVLTGAAAGLSGRVPVGTGGLIIAGHDDIGYWVVEPGIVDPVFPTDLDFTASVVLGEQVVAAQPIDLLAVGLDGEVGPVTTLSLTPELPAVPSGKVVVSLDWDTESDLDLRVVDPTGVEIWSHKINSYTEPPPPTVVGPTDYLSGGILDFDSNANCVIDGRRQENVVWAQTAPPGAYLVRVDTFSLCGQPTAHWNLRVFVDGALVYQAHGTSLPTDTRFDHGAGAGLYVGSFTVSGN